MKDICVPGADAPTGWDGDDDEADVGAIMIGLVIGKTFGREVLFKLRKLMFDGRTDE